MRSFLVRHLQANPGVITSIRVLTASGPSALLRVGFTCLTFFDRDFGLEKELSLGIAKAHLCMSGQIMYYTMRWGRRVTYPCMTCTSLIAFIPGFISKP